MWLLYLLAVVASCLAAASDPRIIGGFEADQDATAHQVSIRYRTVDQQSFGRGHFCGGSLINNRTVLTAAHCLVDMSNGRKIHASTFRVVGGSLERLRMTADTAVVDVAQTIVHENFNTATTANDIALIILSEPIPDDHPTLKPIDLVSRKPSDSTQCQASGWGTTVSEQNVSPDILLAVNVTVVPTVTCNASDSYYGHIEPGMFCAGQADRDSCQGDSGGPLVCNGLLAGVVSHGYKCGLEGFPGIYADVAYYRSWIEQCLEGGCSGAGALVISSGVLYSVGLLAMAMYYGQ